MRLYLIRHGETDWNKVKRLQGKSDIILNEFGEHLAIETGKALKQVPFDLAYTSPLKRARRTAELVLGEKKVPIIDDSRIEEMGFGIYEGLVCKEGASEIPDKNFSLFFHSPEKYTPPEGGESFDSLLERTGDFLKSLQNSHECANKTILISTHGAALCALICNIKGASLKDFWGTGVHKNCAVTIVDVTNGQYKILEEGKTYYKDEVQPW